MFSMYIGPSAFDVHSLFLGLYEICFSPKKREERLGFWWVGACYACFEVDLPFSCLDEYFFLGWENYFGLD